MLTVFNRKELIITLDMDQQADIRRILSENGIDYEVKTTNLQNAAVVGSSRGRLGSFGIDQDYTYEYKFFVHRKDYDRAKRLIQ